MSLSKLESSSSELSLAFNQSKFIEMAIKMKNEGKIKTDLDFARKFMFAFENSAEKFCVNLNFLVDYGVYDRKDNAKAKLLKHFLQGTDYEVQNDSPELSGKPNRAGGRPSEIIKLTVDCFKGMCMLSQNDAGHMVRGYYLDMEHISKACIADQLKESERLRLKAEKLHAQNIQRHRYFKFGKKGPVFYIIVSGIAPADGIIRIKIGVAGCQNPKPKKCKKCGHKPQIKTSNPSIDSRLAEHRTLWPQLQVLFVAYTKDAQLLERNIKRVYKNKINPNGHEIIEDVQSQELIETVSNYLNLFDTLEQEPSFLIEENLEMYNQQALVPIRLLQESEERIMAKLEVIEEKLDEQKVEIKDAIKDSNIQSAKLILPLVSKYQLLKLRDVCREYNLTVKGNKPDLILRIKEHLSNVINGIR
jgi:phage anti-repressor protein